MMIDKKENKYDFIKELKKDWYLILLVLAMFFLSIILYSKLPERMPTHWNLAGEVDGYSSRFWGAFMMPLLSVGILLLMLLTPLIDPRRENYQKFNSTYRIIRSIIVIFFAGLHLLVLASSLGSKIDIGRFVTLGLGLLFMVMGNYLPKIRHNYFLGVRVPWTLASGKVWKKTHRLAGKVFVISGIIMFSSIFLSDIPRFWLLIFCVLGSTLGITLYSYLIYKKEKEE